MIPSCNALYIRTPLDRAYVVTAKSRRRRLDRGPKPERGSSRRNTKAWASIQRSIWHGWSVWCRSTPRSSVSAFRIFARTCHCLCMVGILIRPNSPPICFEPLFRSETLKSNCPTAESTSCRRRETDCIREAAWRRAAIHYQPDRRSSCQQGTMLPQRRPGGDRHPGARCYHKRLISLAPGVGLEPTTQRLTAACSTD